MKASAVKALATRAHLLLSLALFGCATFHPMPLTAAAVTKKLEIPDAREIRIQARSIKHPILRPVLFDDRDGLSPDEAGILAVILNPRLRAARDQKGIAKAQLLQAGILPNPQLSYSFKSPVGGDKNGAANGQGLGLNWAIHSLLSRGARLDSARAHETSVELEVAWKEWEVAEAARLHFYRLVIVRKRFAIAERLLGVREQALEILKRGLSLGLKTTLDLSAGENAAQDAQAVLIRASSAREVERLALNHVLGFPGSKRMKLQKDVHINLPEKLPSVQTLEKGLDERRIDLLALRLGYQSQEASVRAAIRSQFPKISIGFGVARDNDGLDTLNAGISIGIPIFDRNQGRIAEARATRKQLFDEYVARIFDARAQIARLLEHLRAVKKRRESLRASIQSLKKMTEHYRIAVAKGLGNILDSLTLMDRLHERQLQFLALEEQLANLAIALEIASGRYLFTSGTTPPETDAPTQKRETSK